MSRKELIIISILVVCLGTSMHFVHHLSCFNHFMGYIFPIVETVWEHMKMIFYPMLLLGIYLSISRKDISQISGPIIAGITGFPICQAAFYSYWIFTKTSILWVDMITYIVLMIGLIFGANQLNKNNNVRQLWPVCIFAAIAVAIIVGYLTYHPADMIFFEEE